MFRTVSYCVFPPLVIICSAHAPTLLDIYITSADDYDDLVLDGDNASDASGTNESEESKINSDALTMVRPVMPHVLTLLAGIRSVLCRCTLRTVGGLNVSEVTFNPS